MREGAQSWHELLVNLQARGLAFDFSSAVAQLFEIKMEAGISELLWCQTGA